MSKAFKFIFGILARLVALLPSDAKRIGRYFEKEDWQNALRMADDYVKANPELDTPYMVRARAYIELEEFEKALDDCNTAIGLDPGGSSVAYLSRAVAFGFLTQHARTIEDINRAIRLSPVSPEVMPDFGAAVHTNLGWSYAKLGDFQTAIKESDLAIEQSDEAITKNIRHNMKAIAYINRSYAHAMTKEFAKAEEDCNQALLSKPFHSLTLAMAYNNRAWVKLHQARYREALDDANVAIVKYPKLIAAYINRATTQERLEQREKAFSDYGAVITINPACTVAYDKRARLYDSMGDHDLASKDREEMAKHRDWKDPKTCLLE